MSVSDPEMGHGRKSTSRRFDGHKMDLITDEASKLVLGLDVRAANAPDGEGAIPLLDRVHRWRNEAGHPGGRHGLFRG
jgi:hypothetical protein